MPTLTDTAPPYDALPEVRILDLPIHIVDMDQALTRMDGYIRNRTPRHIVTADASMLVMAQEDAALRTIINTADLVTPDSVGILWAARRHGATLRERVSGVDIVERLCSLSHQNNYRIYFLGAAPGIAEQAAERMRAKYPGAQIVGVRDGFFKENETADLLESIRQSRPDILCVAMGIPKQEKWIAKYRNQLGVPVLIGVGGTLDVLSGTVRRAPRVMQKARLEWLWRVISNPRKINKVLLLPRFVIMVQRNHRTG